MPAGAWLAICVAVFALSRLLLLDRSLGAARFFRRLGRAEHSRKLKVEGEGLRLELRYFKAAANGLFKGLKDVVALPIDE